MGDITQTGNQDYRKIREQIQESFQPIPSASDLYQIYRPQVNTPVGNLLADYGYGESRYDEHIGSIPQLENIADVRALNQSRFNKFAAGITKGVGLAATTFLDGTAGLIYGIGQGIAEGRVSALWDNDLSNALQDFNKGMEEVLPNYKTKEEQERPWWQNMGTANFWADGFLKNLGFTVGAFYSGNAWTQGLKALGWVKKATSAQVVGSLLSGFNEGRIEANNGQREFMDKERMLIQSAKEKRAEEIAAMPGYSDEEKIAMLKELDQNAELQEQKALERGHKMGLATLIGNTVLLSLDNMWQFGKLYSRGFKNAKGLANKIEKGMMREGIEDVVEGGVKKYAAKNTSKAAKIARGFSNGLVEGNEEMAQAFISETAGYWMSPDSPDAYYNALIDPEAKMETRGFLSAAAEGLNNSYGSGDRWEEFAIGMFTGLLGMPTFGKLNNSDANTWIGKGKAVGISGGLVGEMRSATQKEAEENEAVQVMNKYLDKIRTNAGYFSQSQSFTNAMDGFAAENNNFEYKNMANNDDFAAISRFARTGRLEDLKEMVNQDFENMPDEQLADIAINTTPNIRMNPDGTVLYEDSVNNDTEVGGWRNPADGKLMSESEEGRAKMREDLIQKRDKILHEIDEYEKSVETVRALGNNSLSEDQVNELAWYDWKVKMFNDRFNSIKESQKTFLGALRSSLAEYISDNLADTHEANLSELGGRQEGESEEDYKKRLQDRAKEKKKTLNINAKENPIAALQTVEDYLAALFSADSALKFGSLVANNIDIVNAIDAVPNRQLDESFEAYNKRLQESGNNMVLGSILEELSGLSAQEYKDRIKDIADAGRIANAAKGFNERYKEFSENPLKLVQNRSKLEAKVKEKVDKINEQRTQRQSDNIAKRFDFTANTASIAKTLEENRRDIEAVGGLDVWMNKLPEDQRKKVKKAITFQKGIKGIKDAFDSTDAEGLREERMRRIAKALIDEAAEKSDDLDDLEETANKLLNTSMVDDQIKNVASNLNDAELLETVNDVKMAIKEVFRDNFEAVKKAAKQFEAIEKANEKEEQKSKKAKSTGDKTKEQENPIDKEKIPKEAKPLVVPGGMNDSKKAPEDTMKFNTRGRKQSGNLKKGKGPKENKPQISEFFINEAVDEETYLDFIKRTGNRPKLEGGYTKEDYDKYIEETHKWLKENGAFEYVRHHLQKGEKLEFYIDEELNQKAGTTVVLIRTGNGQLVGSMPTDIDFKSIPFGEKTTMQALEPEKYELFKKITGAYEQSKNKETLYTTGVEALRGGNPSWSSRNFSVASIFENTGDKPVIGIVNSSGFIETADRRASAIDESILPGELKSEGQVYILIPSSSGKYVPALAYGKPIHEIIGTSVKGEIFENDGWEDDWYIQKMVEVLQKAPTRINAENSMYNEELFRWLRVNNMSIRAKYKDNGDTKNDYSKDLNRATYLLISYDKDDGKTDFYSIPLENKQITKEAALKAIKTIAFRNKNITTNVILGEMNSSNAADYVSHISNYLFTNIIKGRTHTINDYFVYKAEDFNKRKNEQKIKETPPERKDKSNTKTTTIEVDGTNYEVGQNNSSIKNIDTGKTVPMGSEEYFKVLSALNTKSTITVASDTPIAPQGTSPVTQEELARKMAEMNGEKPTTDSSNKDNKPTKPQRRGFLETSRVSNEPKATERQLKREMRVAKRMLPSLSEEGRMSVINGLIRVTTENGNPIEAYGRFVNGMIQISSAAPMGTSYHESFHYVVDMLLNDEERENMFQEAEKQYNMSDRMELEEKLAEDFRAYMNKKTDTSLRGIIRRLFEKLKSIINGTKNKKTALDTLFNDIYSGSFRNRIEKQEQYDIDNLQTDDDNWMGYNNSFKYYKDAKNAKALLESMLEHSDNSENKELAKVLLTIPNLVYIPIYYDYSKLSQAISHAKNNGSVNLGVYHPASNRIKLLVAMTSDSFEGTALHEIIHAVTTREYKLNEEFRKEIDRLYEIAKAHGVTGYGMTNAKEFIAEGFTNLTFIDSIRAIPDEASRAKHSIFDSFINAVVNLLEKYFGKKSEANIASIHDSLVVAVANNMQVVFNKDYISDSVRNFINQDWYEPLNLKKDTFEEDLLDYRYRKTDYSKLDSETKEYLKARGISEEEYQNLAAEQREFLLHCM